MKSYRALLLPVFLILATGCGREHKKIDRYALVTRHNVKNLIIHPLNALSVGNGSFAYTADFTGMQSFPDYYEHGVRLGTQSDWGWHSFPNPDSFAIGDVQKYYASGSKLVPYTFQFTNDSDERKNLASQWLRENPHRLHLGIIGLSILKGDSTPVTFSDINLDSQLLDLWTGELLSSFRVDSSEVKVWTVCHQELDMVSFRITSDLVADGKIRVRIRFPYADHDKFGSGVDLDSPEKHTSEIVRKSGHNALFMHQLDDTRYYAKVAWKKKAHVETGQYHEYLIVPEQGNNTLEVSCCFSKEPETDRLPLYSATARNSRNHMKEFWKSGGAVDFSACTDPRAKELERRVVLSQYLTRIQCAGSLPPQETGLTYNSWYGKFHLEMHWWHAMHFILWDRKSIAEKQFAYYNTISGKAMSTSARQGYDGTRWPKMTGPSGDESPGTINPFIIWQQPHIIYFAELLYNSYGKDRSILERYKTRVLSTAAFMASFARWDSTAGTYVLGPPVMPGQERYHADSTYNPSFELEYWYWGLSAAQKWRSRLGMEPDKYWNEILQNLPLPVIRDSLYLFAESAADSYENPMLLADHPMVLGMTGFLPPTKRIDKEIMRNTLLAIREKWYWKTAWGWDFPMAAMCATSLEMPDLAVDFLLMTTPKNKYLPSGHNFQDETLTVYLPGNGALLTAVAMMCSYRNGNGGFPRDGQWNVKYENLYYPY